MKHEYCTCDRCGSKIDVNMQKLSYVRRFTNKNFATKIKTTTYEPMSTIDDVIKTTKDEMKIVSMQIETSYWNKHKTFDLCGNCRKDFEKFMNSEV